MSDLDRPVQPVAAPASGVGNGTATFTAAANTTQAARQGTLGVAGQIVTVTQSP